MSAFSFRVVIFSGLFFLSTLAGATTPQFESVQVSDSYVLGDSETMVEARLIVKLRIKQKASDRFGSLVSGTSTVSNGKLDENIRVITSSLMTLSDVKETVTVNSNNRTVLNMTATATINKTVLLDKATSLETENQLKEELAMLRKENADLHRQFKIDTTASDSKTSKSAVSPHLTFKEMALQTTAKKEFNESIMREELLKPVLNTSVSASVVSVDEYNDDDRFYQVSVNLNWSIEHEGAKQVFDSFGLETRSYPDEDNKPVLIVSFLKDANDDHSAKSYFDSMAQRSFLIRLKFTKIENVYIFADSHFYPFASMHRAVHYVPLMIPADFWGCRDAKPAAFSKAKYFCLFTHPKVNRQKIVKLLLPKELGDTDSKILAEVVEVSMDDLKDIVHKKQI
ncbi:hypothetical protein GCM10023116_29520 [Kistimonas scapharcae]|uniref:Uncharacterized protein n=1 Tax=Kistimonas scapharcae TaxID=1036133 RepID=A0ABP8V5H0_9GAMM